MTFSLRALALGCLVTCAATLATAQTLTQIRNAGSRATRLNVVFFGDGYTTAEESKFQGDAATHLQVMLDDESWSRFAGHMNAFTIYTASAESGADDPVAGITRNTYFSASYNTSGIDRLLTIASGANGTAKVLTLLTQFVPDYDVIVILVNSTKYGGAGGTFLTTSLNTSSREILLHELGHNFAKLTDEYVDAAAAPSYAVREYPNATQTTTRAASPWRDFIPLTTALPTTVGPDENTVGHFLGAHYRDVGFYRPTNNSKMNSLNRPFGPVNLRAYAAQFHALNLEAAPVGAVPTLVTAPVGGTVAAGGVFQLQAQATGAGPITYQWRQNGVYVPTGNGASLPLVSFAAAQAGTYSVEMTNARGTVTSADVIVAVSGSLGMAGSSVTPVNNAAVPGQDLTLTATFPTTPSSYQWQRNGTTISGAGAASLTLANVQPADTGLYAALWSGATPSFPAIVGVSTNQKVIGTGAEVGPNIVHQNGGTYDQVLLTGAAASLTADANQVTRISFIDLTNDIVQVEFSGAGTLSLVLQSPSGPAAPVNYNQPGTAYMKGHASIVITGANETTNLGIFSVGRATAVNQSLFRDDVTYDGMADIGFVAISSSNGKFGGVRTANTSYFNTSGYTGIYARGIEFVGPVFVGDISASGSATPMLTLGSGNDVRITGGDLQQLNNRAVQVDGFSRLQMTAGANSHSVAQPAQPLRTRLERFGVDVTGQIGN